MNHEQLLLIWPSLHLGCATTLPPIQKNSSASLEMEVLCQSFGELIIDWLGELTAPEDGCLVLSEEALPIVGENIPGDKEPKDWKLVFLGDAGAGLPLRPGDSGAMAGAVSFIPELFI